MSISFTQSLKVTVAALAVALAGAAVSGGTSPAEAKKLMLVKSGHHFHNSGYWRSGVFFVGSGYGYYRTCRWLKVRAIETGRQYWWDRYYACKGD